MTRITSSKRPMIALALTLVALFLTAGGLAKTFSRLSETGRPEKISPAVLANLAQPVSAPFTSTPNFISISEPQDSPSLQVARRGHSATLLADGRILIAGGENADGPIRQCEIFDSATGTFSVGGNLNAPRTGHTATKLSDGRVLLAGGRNALGPLASTEIFDPQTGVFSNGPTLN